LCPPEDEHTFSPLVLTYLLRRRGRMATFLGANVPLQRFEETLQALKPQLVIITAQDLQKAAALLTFSDLLASRDIPLAYGGLVFTLIPELRERIPGYFLGETLTEAPDSVEQLLIKRPTPKQAPTPSEAYLRALATLTERHAALIARLATNLEQEGIHPRYLTDANLHLTEDVIAALQLGDLHFLAQNMEWVKGLIKNYGIPTDSLDRYMSSYQQALKDVMGEDGDVVIEYFEALA
jgi:hypothetical protein